jgi:hypothetical protein
MPIVSVQLLALSQQQSSIGILMTIVQLFITRKGKGKGKRLGNPIWPTKSLSHARQYR